MLLSNVRPALASPLAFLPFVPKYFSDSLKDFSKAHVFTDEGALKYLYMDGKVPAEDGGNSQGDQLPPVGKDVLVEHNGHQFMAYRDSIGNWRDSANGNILSGDVHILGRW